MGAIQRNETFSKTERGLVVTIGSTNRYRDIPSAPDCNNLEFSVRPGFSCTEGNPRFFHFLGPPRSIVAKLAIRCPCILARIHFGPRITRSRRIDSSTDQGGDPIVFLADHRLDRRAEPIGDDRGVDAAEVGMRFQVTVVKIVEAGVGCRKVPAWR